MTSKISLLTFAICLLIFSGCKKANEYPVEPLINFKSLTTDKNSNGKDIAGRITFSFTDGDGDIGLADNDTFPPYNPSGQYYYNLVLKYFSKPNGVWIPNTAYHLNGRLPVITPEGTNKAIRGDIEYFIYGLDQLPQCAVNLPVRFELYIYDRALHRSNTITTEEILINTP